MQFIIIFMSPRKNNSLKWLFISSELENYLPSDCETMRYVLRYFMNHIEYA